MGKLAAALLMALTLGLVACLAVPGAPEAEGGKRMIRGLDDLVVVTSAQAARFPEPQEAIELTLAGEPLPYDADAGAYLIPQSAQTGAFDGAVELRRVEGYSYYLCMDAPVDKAQALAEGTAFDLYGVSGDRCAHARVIFTPQVVLCLNTDAGGEPGDEDEGGELLVYTARDGRIALERTRMRIRLRGNTSRRMPKKSFRLHLEDERGDKFHLSIAGLRTDDDWILNPMYADTSKIREKLAYELWEDFNSVGESAASSRVEHVEVLLNGRYWGLYSLQERVDNKQVDGDKRADLLYKVVANDRPTVEELLACKETGRFRAFELQNGDTSGAQNLWAPAADYIAFLEGGEGPGVSALSGQNVVDYGLWAMLTQAHDNHFKNQYLNCVYAGGRYTAYKIPWDVNHTFGDVWRGEDEQTNFTGYLVGSLVMDGAFEALLGSGDEAVCAAVRARWAQLRAGVADGDAIVDRAREMHAQIQGALARDSLRWPQCGMGEGNAMNIRDIEDFIHTTLMRMDTFVEGLGA